MPVPDGVDLVTAAALPEVACTVWSNVFMVAGLRPEETLLVHGGAGGIGTFAIQLAAAYGARVFTTAGTPEKRDLVRELGAEIAIDYREEDFVEVVKQATDGAGCRRHPRQHGRVLPGAERRRAGHRGTARRSSACRAAPRPSSTSTRCCASAAAIVATTLRARPAAEKAAICAAVVEHVWPLVADGSVRAVVDTTLPLDRASEAHALMESGEHSGKILLTT